MNALSYFLKARGLNVPGGSLGLKNNVFTIGWSTGSDCVGDSPIIENTGPIYAEAFSGSSLNPLGLALYTRDRDIPETRQVLIFDGTSTWIEIPSLVISGGIVGRIEATAYHNVGGLLNANIITWSNNALRLRYQAIASPPEYRFRNMNIFDHALTDNFDDQEHVFTASWEIGGSPSDGTIGLKQEIDDVVATSGNIGASGTIGIGANSVGTGAFIDGSARNIRIYQNDILIHEWKIDDGVADLGEITDSVGGKHGILHLGTGHWETVYTDSNDADRLKNFTFTNVLGQNTDAIVPIGSWDTALVAGDVVELNYEEKSLSYTYRGVELVSDYSMTETADSTTPSASWICFGGAGGTTVVENGFANISGNLGDITVTEAAKFKLNTNNKYRLFIKMANTNTYDDVIKVWLGNGAMSVGPIPAGASEVEIDVDNSNIGPGDQKLQAGQNTPGTELHVLEWSIKEYKDKKSDSLVLLNCLDTFLVEDGTDIHITDLGGNLLVEDL